MSLLSADALASPSEVVFVLRLGPFSVLTVAAALRARCVLTFTRAQSGAPSLLAVATECAAMTVLASLILVLQATSVALMVAVSCLRTDV